MRGRDGLRPELRRQGKRLTGWLVVIGCVLLTISVVYLANPYDAPDRSVEKIEADDGVRLDTFGGGYVLEPAEGTAEACLVFYPGGRVHPKAYVESLAPLARDANVTVVIPRMPLNLAVVDHALARTGLRDGAADRAMAAHSSIEKWYVGGHSLGGAMACRYARDNSDAVEGIILYAAYCDRDVSETGLAVLSLTGSADSVIDRRSYEDNLANLPANATVTEISGLNHTQFGSYRGQDEPSGTGYDVAHERLNDETLAWFDNRTALRTGAG